MNERALPKTRGGGPASEENLRRAFSFDPLSGRGGFGDLLHGTGA